jgi:hypothetical protein
VTATTKEARGILQLVIKYTNKGKAGRCEVAELYVYVMKCLKIKSTVYLIAAFTRKTINYNRSKYFHTLVAEVSTHLALHRTAASCLIALLPGERKIVINL